MALNANTKVGSKFADLCDLSATSGFTLLDTMNCFQFCMLVFGRVQAKYLALKYNNNLYRGKNTTNLRSNAAAHTWDNKKKKEEYRHKLESYVDKMDEEIDGCTKFISKGD